MEFSDLDEENKKVDNIMNKYYKNYPKKNYEKSVDNSKVNHKDLNNKENVNNWWCVDII